MGERPRRKRLDFLKSLKFWRERDRGRDILTGTVPWSGPSSGNTSHESIVTVDPKDSNGSSTGSEDVACQTSYCRLVERIIYPPDSQSRVSNDDISVRTTESGAAPIANVSSNVSTTDSVNAKVNGKSSGIVSGRRCDAACNPACEPSPAQPSLSSRYVWWKRLAARIRNKSPPSDSSNYRISPGKENTEWTQWNSNSPSCGSKRSQLEDRSNDRAPVQEHFSDTQIRDPKWSPQSSSRRSTLPNCRNSSYQPIPGSIARPVWTEPRAQRSGLSHISSLPNSVHDTRGQSDTSLENVGRKSRHSVSGECVNCYKAASCTYHVPYRLSKRDLEEPPVNSMRKLEEAAKQLSREEYKNWPSVENVYNPIDEVPLDPNPPKWRRFCFDICLVVLSILFFVLWFSARWAAYQSGQLDESNQISNLFVPAQPDHPCISCAKVFNPIKTMRQQFQTFTGLFINSRENATKKLW